MAEVVCVLYVALAKLLVHEEMAKVRMVVQHCVPIESGMITMNIGSYIGLSSEWMATNPRTILRQCRELLAFANSSIPGILETLIQRSLLPMDAGEKSNYLQAASSTSLELLKTAWFCHKSPWAFLVDYVENERICDVPRNSLVQQVLDCVYESYVESHTSEYQQCRQHWERVKDTEAVRRFLTDEMENGIFLCGSGFYATQMYIRLARQHLLTPENLQLLFGTPEVSQSVVYVDLFFAYEHLVQVRYLPEVLSFCKMNDIIIPDDDEENNVVVVTNLLDTLREKKLATEENTTLLLGDNGIGGWWLEMSDQHNMNE